MKICQSCNRIYENPNVRFCGADGLPLTEQIAEKIETETQVISPVAFTYSRHNGNPLGSDYKWHKFEGKASADENWQISFADKSFKKTYRDFSIIVGGKIVDEINILLTESKVGNFGEMGGSSNLDIYFADGSKQRGEADRETARKWEGLLFTLLMENQNLKEINS